MYSVLYFFLCLLYQFRTWLVVYTLICIKLVSGWLYRCNIMFWMRKCIYWQRMAFLKYKINYVFFMNNLLYTFYLSVTYGHVPEMYNRTSMRRQYGTKYRTSQGKILFLVGPLDCLIVFNGKWAVCQPLFKFTNTKKKKKSSTKPLNLHEIILNFYSK